MTQELNFDLSLSIAPPSSLSPELYEEFNSLYNSIRLLADQVAGGNMLEWVEYEELSTLSGWSSFSTKDIQYRYLNLNTVLVNFVLVGTSNSSSSSFTLPSACLNTVTCASGLAGDSGILSVSPGKVLCTPGSNLVILSKDLTGANWTASGTKSIAGQFIYRSA